ncbi:hypothetical protein CROQUDRAFT_91231 [Cronartium quercuum f. sp. fusiforme G11]|uniref:Uncharacterized protein n=1 Tax=Cronartium quercuum f. sp. fusiforme G11 TaxID=708437 RepID=A0A9P6NKK6_9BASI|nr:hypothetical protein CROQUDRAFT_91231 [Cronartium quercuum f. sp. fusiforme G11]
MNILANLQEIPKKNYKAQQEQIAMQNQIITQMQEQASMQDLAYEQLLTQFQSASSISSPKKKGKARALTGSIQNQKSTNLSTKPSQTTSSRKKVPSKPAAFSSTPWKQPSRATGPKSANSCVQLSVPLKESPKRSPHQVAVAEWPEGFESTKGLILAGAVPKAPDPALLNEFDMQFSDISDINRVLDSPTAQNLVPTSKVITLAEAQAGCMKIDWFNNSLDPSQRTNIVDCDNVMFLPNAEASLLGKQHPDEKLSNKKFTEKYCAEASAKCNMDHRITNDDDDDDRDADNLSYHQGSIDLEETDGEEDGEDEEFEEEEEDEHDDLKFNKDDENWGKKGEEEEYEDGDGMSFEETGKGKGLMFSDDYQMFDGDEDAQALRYDAWADA